MIINPTDHKYSKSLKNTAIVDRIIPTPKAVISNKINGMIDCAR